jgi:YesN/AraC family two-component response regulator
LEAARNEAPDLLISDVLMPELSGIELAIQVQEHSPDCKILLLSGQAATTGVFASAKAKGYNFQVMLKPVHPKDLLTQIQLTFATGSEPSPLPPR